MLNSVDNDEKLNGTIFRAGQGREMWFLAEDEKKDDTNNLRIRSNSDS